MAESDSTHLRHILKRLEQVKARAKARKAPTAPPKAADADNRHVDSDRHQPLAFFVAAVSNAHPKDDLASMEHPLFALRAGDRTVRAYERGGCTVTVIPSALGAATIHDKDILIYCISQLMRALDEGWPVSRTVRFTAHDFLVSTNRQTSGQGYKLLSNALSRLRGTNIETNIKTGGRRARAGFGLIDSWSVVEKSPDNDRMVSIEVTLSKWLYRSVTARQIKTISRDYFRLRSPLDRRIYELAVKHCGNQPKWRAKITTLHQKSGSQASLREFRRSVRALAEANTLPDYRLVFDTRADAVTFYDRRPKGANAQF